MPLRKNDEERQAARERHQREKGQRAAEQKQALEQDRARKQALRSERSARRGATTVLLGLGVAVRDGQVFKSDFGVVTGRGEGRCLGDLAGAHAEVTGGRSGHRRSGHARTADTLAATAVLGPVGLLAGASRTGTRGTAFIVFNDGGMNEKRINDQSSLVKAQADAVRFNALAAAHGGQVVKAATAAQASTGPALDQQSAGSRLADELGRLAGLHASGVLTDAEFQAAKAMLLGT
jgi:putative oligomerization/nucleic acid binding protein